MIQIQRLVFNTFQVNTYILWDETKECAIIDAGCYDDEEEASISGFIRDNGLKPVRLLQTHCHIDHIAGMAFISHKYSLKAEAHPAGVVFIKHSQKTAFMYGMDDLVAILPELPLKEGDIIKFGNIELSVVETPGHADGSVCFINHNDKFVITGDVLFSQSIGRSDLPTGDYDLLLKSIREKLLTLPGDYKVYPGHGPDTTIGYEAYSNPFLT